MVATRTVLKSSSELREQLPLLPSTGGGPRTLPHVEWRTRAGAVLHPSPIGDPDEVLSVNLTAGCAVQCSFCSVRAAPSYPGDAVVALYANTPELLASELVRRRKRPRAVYVSPATDPFPPLVDVQTEAVRVVETLTQYRVQSWLMTRGYIKPFALRQLTACRKYVRVTVAMTTLDRTMQRALEPLAAPPDLRLRQIATLVNSGISVQVALEPLIPGLTDTPAALRGLLGALARVGVTRLTAGYLFLRPRIKENLVLALRAYGIDESVLDVYDDGPVLKGETLAAARYLPKRDRQRRYAALMSLAAEFGITARISGLTNPDFQAPARTEATELPRLMSFAS